MSLLSYIEIENFKSFGVPIKVHFDNPSVLIGPNNAGKTTVIQALALWGWGIKKWHEKKGTSQTSKNLSTSLSRSDIIQVPVKETRYFWKDAKIRIGADLVEMKLTVGVYFQDKIENCCLIFKYYNAEQIYCYPSEATFAIKGLLQYVAGLKIDLLYPMSGMEIEEPLLQEGRINVLIGQGQTAQVLRNLCYKVIENSEEDWKEAVKMMKNLFFIDLQKPFFNQTRGSIELKYTANDAQKNYPLDISLAGRGQQQILLLIAYLLSHKGSILLIDEPDAHLEILRQRQVFALLKELSKKNTGQVIIATHSEVIVDEAVDVNLTLLLNGKSTIVSDKIKVKDTLRTFGIEHYYKAELKKSVLYIEGSTDIEMLKAFAKQLNHPVKELLDATLYYYYTQDSIPEDGFEKEITKGAGYFKEFKKHFYAIKSCVPELKGIGIFDSDGRTKMNEMTDALAILYWTRYELENYFVEPTLIEKYILSNHKAVKDGIFLKNIIENETLHFIFDGNQEDFDAYISDVSFQKRRFRDSSKYKKLSLFLENIFQKYAEYSNKPLLLSKGNFFEMISYMNPTDIDKEVKEKLDYLYQYLKSE